MWTAGQVIGLIHDIPTCEELVSRIQKEALETLGKVSSLIVDKQPPPDIAGKKIGEKTDPRDDGKALRRVSFRCFCACLELQIMLRAILSIPYNPEPEDVKSKARIKLVLQQTSIIFSLII